MVTVAQVRLADTLEGHQDEARRLGGLVALAEAEEKARRQAWGVEQGRRATAAHNAQRDVNRAGTARAAILAEVPAATHRAIEDAELAVRTHDVELSYRRADVRDERERQARRLAPGRDGAPAPALEKPEREDFARRLEEAGAVLRLAEARSRELAATLEAAKRQLVADVKRVRAGAKAAAQEPVTQ